ncbi:sensor domain-containing diguanylate cyclase [Butyrivibrio sp. AC2005]|uniref:sensor domain-containing diguanylate cyclase n=1 Tax=Butyrivibrio sp. AC2005 TaxID=1280672 RepID=UPI0004174D3F|nr:diguanylate cyclase [Butyrivibrio sp. AC2005]
MKFKQTAFTDTFTENIKQWAAEIPDRDNSAIFHVYVPYQLDNKCKKVDEIRNILLCEAVGIPIIGCSATGEILDGQMRDDDIVVTLMIFEDPGTQVEVFSTYSNSEEFDAEEVLEYAMGIPHLKGIEILTACNYQRLEAVGMVFDRLPKDVDIFGGVAVGDTTNAQIVFVNDHECSSNGSVFVFYVGPELHIQTNRMFGWKAIGYPMKVTKSEGALVYEIDGKPAYDVYNHYLQIKKNENFFYDALEFPFEVQVDENTKYIRHAKSVNPDGSIVMSTNVPQGSYVRLTYGDPRRIIEHTKQSGLLVRDFAPEVVLIINCMGRKLFWGGKENIEIAEVSKYMKTTGFSALGEIMRYRSTTVLNNLSIVAVAMREGAAKKVIDLDLENMNQDTSMPITARLAIFINTITDELMDKNSQLGEMLYKASHDALTGLLNRGAIERLIYESYENSKNTPDWHLIMFDIDNFKQINDQYGHIEGDKALKLVSDYLLHNVCSLSNVEAGRWGGEEFMILLTGYTDLQIYDLAETIRKQIKQTSEAQIAFTISVGITKHLPEESVPSTLDRVDALLYDAKNNGKNMVCSDLE